MEKKLDLDEFFREISEFGRYQKLVVLLLTIPGCFMNAYNMFAIVFLTYSPEHHCKLEQNTDDTAFAAHDAKLSIFKSVNGSATAEEKWQAIECGIEVYRRNDDEAAADNDTWGLYKTRSCSNGYTFDREYFDSTMITDWELVCGKEVQVKIMMSILGLFSLIGCTLIAWIQDKYGRRTAFMWTNHFYIISGLVSLVSPNLFTFAVLRALSGLSTIAGFNVCYTWAMEYVGPHKRTLTSTIFCISYALGTMSLGLLAYLCSSWIQLGIATTLPFAVTYSYYFIIMESPRWLVSQGRLQEAEAVLTRIASWENIELSPKILDRLLQPPVLSNGNTATEKHEEHSNQSQERSKDKNSQSQVDNAASASKDAVCKGLHKMQIFDLFRGPTLRKKTIIITFCWISNAVGYLTIAYNVENLGGNLYLTYVIQAAMEAPATMLNLLILNRFGRVLPLCIAMTFSGIMCLLTAPGDAFPAWLIITLAALGKFGISSGLDTLYQLANELYPTPLRGMGIGLSSTVAELGNVLMPYIILSSEAYRMFPMIILGTLSVVSGVFVLLLPETLNKNMPQTLEDAETVGKVGFRTLLTNLRIKRNHRDSAKSNKSAPGVCAELGYTETEA